MTTTDVAATRTGQAPRPPKRRTRRRRPGPFPVTIVRPAAVAVEAITPDQRMRQQAANRTAHQITEASREGTRSYLDVYFDWSPHYVHSLRDLAAAIIRDAPARAENPPAGAARVGRNLRGEVVVAVLHAADWSLLLRPAQPHPEVWVFIRDAALCVGGGADVLSVEWDEMADTVFTALTTGPRTR